MSQHPVPDAAFDKHVALLGMTGAGKTSVIKAAIVEPDLAADRRVLIVTPKDDWWGLRLSKTGKSDGFDIPIFGGRHEDYPLQVKDAALLAETYGTMKGSAIFCTSRLSVQDRARWFAAFAEKLLSANRGWVRIVIDEAHVFMPKQGGKGGGAIPAALHAGNELVSQGRSGGLRIVLASQRSAKLHNDALTQCSCLIAMLLMAPHDRDAVKDWIEDQADPQRGKEIIASLATLNPGQAWVWAPGAKFLERVQFARPSTFDSSAAPDDGSDAEHHLKPINLDSLRGKLAKVEAEAKAKDPKQIPTLQAEVARLTKALANAGQSVAPDKSALDTAEQRGFERGKKEIAVAADRRVKDARIELLSNLADLIGPLSQLITDGLKAARADKTKIATQLTFVPSAPQQSPRAAHTPIRTAAPRIRAVNGGADGSLPPGERAVLVAAIQYEGVDRDQLSVLTGYKRSSRDAYIQRLREKGYIAIAGQTISPTDEGVAALGDDYVPLPTGAELQDYWRNKLPPGEQAILGALIEVYPQKIDRAELDGRTQYKRSSRDAYVQRLKARRLVETQGSQIGASATLF